MFRKTHVIVLCALLIFSAVVIVLPRNEVNALTISTDTVWNTDKRFFDQSVTINSGVNLYIMPGVTVEFDGWYTIFNNGNLWANGTKAQPITFTSGRNNTAPNDWPGIHFLSGSGGMLNWTRINFPMMGVQVIQTSGVRIENTTVNETAMAGIWFNNADNCVIKNCRINDTGGSGIQMQSGSSGNLVVNTDTYNTDRGVDMDSSGRNTFRNCTVDLTQNEGVRLQNNCDGNTFRDCLVNDTGAQGFNIRSGSSGINITETDILDTNRGLEMNAAPDNRIVNCSIVNSATQGIYIDNGCDRTVLTGLTVTDHGDGMRIMNSDWFRIMDNTITDCTTGDGIRMYFSNDFLIYNNTVIRTENRGIRIFQSTNMNITQNTCRDTGLGGGEAAILVGNSNRNNVTYNTIMYEGNNGITVGPDSGGTTRGNRVEFNTVHHTGNFGINFQDQAYGIVRGNTVSNASSCGIRILQGRNCTLSDNTVNNTRSGPGIVIAGSDNTNATRCISHNNTGDGFVVNLHSQEHPCVVNNDTASDNGGAGYWIDGGSAGTLLNDNYASGNQFGIVVTGGSIRSVLNRDTANYNTAYGIAVLTTGVKVLDSDTLGNLDNGFYLANADNTVLRGCRGLSNVNDSLHIEASTGVTSENDTYQGGVFDVNLTLGSDATLLNSAHTYGKTNVAGGSWLDVWWYLNIRAYDATMSFISAQVNVTDGNGKVVVDNRTVPGELLWTRVHGYYNDSTSIDVSYQDHHLEVTDFTSLKTRDLNISAASTTQDFIFNYAPQSSPLPDPIYIDEDEYLLLNLSNYFSDVEKLLYAATPSANISIIIDQDTGMANISALDDWNGAEPINFNVTDAFGLKAGDTVNVVFNATNDPPYIPNPVPDITLPEGSGTFWLDLTGKLYDVDLLFEGDSHKWYVTGEDGAVFTVAGENSTVFNLTFTLLDDDVFGNRLLTLWLEDSAGAKANQKLWVNITPVNDGPVIGGIPDQTVNITEYLVLDCQPYISDVDTPLPGLIISVDSTYGTKSGFNLTFLYPDSFTPEYQIVNITVYDGQLAAFQLVKITVIRPPPPPGDLFSLSGVVRYGSGGPESGVVVGASVVLLNGTVIVKEGVTDSAGKYLLSEIPPWAGYSLQAFAPAADQGVYGSKSGYLDYEATGMKITVNRTLDVTLTYYEYDESHKGTGMLAGTVFDEATTDPIDSATVMIEGTAAAVLTKPDGRYTIFGIAPGTVKVVAVVSGYESQTKTTEIVADKETKLDFFLKTSTTPPEETGTLKGFVKDDEGGPLENANVHAGLFLGITDSTGYYEFEGVDAGDYTVYVSLPNYVTSDYETVTIPSDGVAWLNFTLVRMDEGKGALRGTVKKENGNALGGAQVVISGPEDRTGTSDSGGGFYFSNLEPGTYTITVTLEGYETETRTVTVQEGQEATVEIEMQETVITTDDDDDDNTTLFAIGAIVILLALIIIILLIVLIVKMSRKKKAEEEGEKKAGEPEKEEEEKPSKGPEEPYETDEEEAGPPGEGDDIEVWDTTPLQASAGGEDGEALDEEGPPGAGEEEDVSFDDDDEDEDISFDEEPVGDEPDLEEFDEDLIEFEDED